MAVILSSEFDISKMSLSALEVRKNREGKDVKSVGILYDGRSLLMQTPSRMRTPFGVSAFSAGPGSKSWSLSVDLDREDADQARFEEVLAAIDEKVISEAQLRSKELFGRERSLPALREGLYNPLVKEPRDPKYNNSLRFKLKVQGDRVVTRVFGADRRRIEDHEAVGRNARVCAILDMSSLYFAGNGCGVVVRATQIVVEQDAPCNFDEFAFRDFAPPPPPPASAPLHDDAVVSETDLYESS